MPNDTPPAYAAYLDRALAANTVRDTGERALFLAAVHELGEDAPPFGADRLEGLLRIVEHFRALLVHDQREILRGPSIAEGERDFVLTVQRIYLEAANAFQRFLRHRADWASPPEKADKRFRITGLALDAIHCFAKWGGFLGERNRSIPWKQMHALYGLAESEGYSQVPFVLHAATPEFKPSVQSLYLRALVLDLVNAGNLTPAQVEIADVWLSSWSEDYSLDADYSSRAHLFCVDLASERGLRIVRSDRHGDTVRYVQADSLKAQLEEVQADLRHGRLHGGNGAAAFPVEEHVALLAIIEKLYRSMLASAENRIEERTPLEDREIDVVVGIERILAKTRRGPEPAAAGDPDVQVWRVKDLSSKGYGLLVDRGAAEEVMLNGAIGLRNQASGGWILAAVARKLANRQRGEILAGVEVLSYLPLRIELAPAEGGPVIGALYLPGSDAGGRLDSIVIRIADFSATAPYRLTAGGASYRIRLNRIASKGADWIRVRFEIEAKA